MTSADDGEMAALRLLDRAFFTQGLRGLLRVTLREAIAKWSLSSSIFPFRRIAKAFAVYMFQDGRLEEGGDITASSNIAIITSAWRQGLVYKMRSTSAMVT